MIGNPPRAATIAGEIDQRLKAIARFASFQTTSKDLDPLYPVLRELQKDMEPEQALWHSILYVAYYNIGSATIAFQEHPEPGMITGPLAKLPTGIERRNLRGEYNFSRHTHDWSEIFHTLPLSTFLSTGLNEKGEDNWQTLQQRLRMAVWGNGRWAAYKTGEVLMKVNRFPLKPTDMGNDFSTGPRKGLALFFNPVPGNGPSDIARLDAQARYLQAILEEQYGVKLAIEELETVLCDFHGMHQGRYYPGHDIDQMQEQLLKQPHSSHGPVWRARAAGLPHRYLGEMHDWQGVDKERCRVYRETGVVIGR